jgi:hypothetical protein
MSTCSQPTLGDVFRTGFQEYMHNSTTMSLDHYKAASAIINCQTPALGGRLYKCEECGHHVPLFNSCRNRHCPQCQAMSRAQWVEKRNNELLPVSYYHIVFTVPEQLKPFALRNKTVFYNILFKAVSETLLQLGANPSFLGGTIGMIAILHTWNQQLMDHPHIHCVVPAGALSEDGVEWIPARKGYLFPVDVLKKVYRGKFMEFFKNAVTHGTMQFHGILQEILPQYRQFVDTLYKTDWVVYLKESFASPDAVIKYLGAYTNRIAISNSRIKSIDDGKVTFSWLDRGNGTVERLLTVPVSTFIQRFLLHVLPSGFVRIRYFGFMSNRNRTEKILQCRAAITAELFDIVCAIDTVLKEELFDVTMQTCNCPHCKKGKLTLIEEIPKRAGPVWVKAA